MHHEDHGGGVAQFAQLIDLDRDAWRRDRSLDQAAIVRVPAGWQACQFPGARKHSWVEEGTLEELCLGLVPLCSIARNPESMHSQLKGGPLHSKMCCRPAGTGYNPIALFQSFKN